MRRANQSGHALPPEGAQERQVLQAWRNDAATSNAGAEGSHSQSRLQANCDAAADSGEMGEDRGGGMSTVDMMVRTHSRKYVLSQVDGLEKYVQHTDVHTMETRDRKTARFQIRMRPDVKEAAERAAVDANRSLASFIETVLIERLKKTGHMK
jgi:hypothetical protein